MDKKAIVRAIRANQIRIIGHADEEAQADGLSYDEILSTVMQGERLESYPRDYPYSSCLIYGSTSAGLPVHSVWAYNQDNQWAVLVTVYRPDPNRWDDWRVRR